MNYNLDNVGSGFDLDDDIDAQDLFDSAAKASVDSGDDAILDGANWDDDFNEATAPEPVSIDPVVEEEPEPVVEEEFVEPEPEPEPYVEPTPEPEPEPEPKYTPPPKQNTTGGRVYVPTEDAQIKDAKKIVEVLDAYRSLSDPEKFVTVQFVTDQADVLDDHVMVVKILNVGSLLPTTMRVLKEAWELDPVDRAFYAMALSTEILHGVGALVAKFESGEEPNKSLSNLEYSRALVNNIDKLGEGEMNFVRATERVLSVAAQED